MNCQDQIDNFIVQNDWKSLGLYLASEHGFIDKFVGGRYCCGAYMEIDGCADINKICWSVFRADCSQPFEKLPHDQRLAASNVIKELRRLYDETEVKLANASYVAFVATRVYDLIEKMSDGFQPIERLEDCVLPGLDSLNQSLTM